MLSFKKILTALATGVLTAAPAMSADAPTTFEEDVATSIDLGLAWLDTHHCFDTSFSCSNATGLALLALLEKRPSPDAVGQGYAGASAEDQARMRRTVRNIIDNVNSQGTSFYAYRDGGYMMGLSVYMVTGGVDKDDGPTTELDGAPLTLKETLDKVFDRTMANQRKGFADDTSSWPAQNGYWCYTNNGCRDSSTTQLAVAGLASARTVYQGGTYADNARWTQLNAATDLARNAYIKNGTKGGGCTDPNAPPANEKGHGYNAGSDNSIQQTASGLWIQLVGGSSLNSATVQAYLRWLQNRYRYDDTNVESIDAGWGLSYWYYLWSSFKAYQFLLDSKAVPTAGHIGVADIGTLPAGDAPACASRQVLRDPATDTRIALFGPEGAGYYGAETKRVYYDYAYMIMSHQCSVAQGNVGYYGCNSSPNRWNSYAEHIYALLVLQRSVGGGCLDTDKDKICDSVDDVVIEPPPIEGGLYCDKNGDGKLTKTEVTTDIMSIYSGKYPARVAVDATNTWANYFQGDTPSGSSKNYIDAYDQAACAKVYLGTLPKKFY